MAKFKMKGGEGAVEFESYIDHDGDFVVKANGQMLFFIDHTDGKLELLNVNDIDGLSLVDDGLGWGGDVLEIAEIE